MKRATRGAWRSQAPGEVSVRVAPEDAALIAGWRADWCAFAREALGVRLDADQEAILRSVQHHPRTVVKSGHARGKDFTAAVATLCFLYLKGPCKVISTAPTGRQVTHIMMSEMGSLWQNARIPLGGKLLQHGIQFDDDPNWFVLGFKAGDKNIEAWTGFHAPRVMVVVTEASGIDQVTFDAIEGILTGDSRLLLVMNPNRTAGEAYAAFKSPLFQKFTLSCLNAPNVQAKRTVIPGQVDWDWVNSLIQKPGWVTAIDASAAQPAEGDFEWEGHWYRPGDLFRVKVMGLWPREPEGQLIPLAWVEAAQDRWREWFQGDGAVHGPLRLGVDVAGMGVDNTVLCWRYGDIVARMQTQARQGHMATAGAVKNALDAEAVRTQKMGESRESREARDLSAGLALVDAIGEGAGVHARLEELGVRSVSVKFSEGARGLRDTTEQRTFANMRAYCYWAIRDALDPQLGGRLALPPIDELTQDLTAVQWTVRSRGEIVLEKKDDIRARLGRSPDWGDALANTYYPDDAAGAVQGGVFEGVGIF